MSNTYYLIGLVSLLTQLHLVQAATDCSTVTQISLAECETLIDLYNNTDGPNWIDNTGWNVTNTPCQWKGVTCSNKKIISISLWGNNLGGLIPSSINKLSNLRSLHLYDNHLSGTIPNTLGDLSNLQSLSLYGNKFGGSIPEFIGNLGRVVS